MYACIHEQAKMLQTSGDFMPPGLAHRSVTRRCAGTSVLGPAGLAGSESRGYFQPFWWWNWSSISRKSAEIITKYHHKISRNHSNLWMRLKSCILFSDIPTSGAKWSRLVRFLGIGDRVLWIDFRVEKVLNDQETCMVSFRVPHLMLPELGYQLRSHKCFSGSTWTTVPRFGVKT